MLHNKVDWYHGESRRARQTQTIIYANFFGGGREREVKWLAAALTNLSILINQNLRLMNVCNLVCLIECSKSLNKLHKCQRNMQINVKDQDKELVIVLRLILWGVCCYLTNIRMYVNEKRGRRYLSLCSGIRVWFFGVFVCVCALGQKQWYF